MLGLEGQASWGGSFLGIGKQPRKQGTRLRSEVELRLWAWTCPIGDMSLGSGSDEVWLSSAKKRGLQCLFQGRRMWPQALGIRRPWGVGELGSLQEW